jgi:integrase
MAQRRVTDQALPDGVYPYTVASGPARSPAQLASGATKRGFTSARAASRFKKSADSAPAQPKQTRDSFAALWPGFLRVRRPYLVPGTYDDYARHGKLRLIPRFGPDKVAAITKADVQDWLADLDEAEELAPKTINNALRVLQAFFTWLVDDRELLLRSPARKVEPLPEDLFEPDWLRPEEIPVYLEACSTEYRPLAELLIGGGPRISEALAVEVDDIDAERQVIYVVRQARKGASAKRGGRRRRDVARTKGKNYRQVVVSRRVIDVLLDQIARLKEQVPDAGRLARVRAPSPRAAAGSRDDAGSARAPRGDRRRSGRRRGFAASDRRAPRRQPAARLACRARPGRRDAGAPDPRSHQQAMAQGDAQAGRAAQLAAPARPASHRGHALAHQG